VSRPVDLGLVTEITLVTESNAVTSDHFTRVTGKVVKKIEETESSIKQKKQETLLKDIQDDNDWS
jgi:hypothetical protein